MRLHRLRPHQSQHHCLPPGFLHIPLPHPQDLLVLLSCLRLPLRLHRLRPHQSQHHCLSLHFPLPFPQPEHLSVLFSFLWLALRHNRFRLQTPLFHRQPHLPFLHLPLPHPQDLLVLPSCLRLSLRHHRLRLQTPLLHRQPHLSFLQLPLPHPQDLLVVLSCLQLPLQPHLPNLQLHPHFLQAHLHLPLQAHLLLRLLRAVHPRHHLPHNPLHLQAHNNPPSFRLPYFRLPHLRRLLHHQRNPRIFLRCFFPLQYLPLSRPHHLVRLLLFLVRPHQSHPRAHRRPLHPFVDHIFLH